MGGLNERFSRCQFQTRNGNLKHFKTLALLHSFNPCNSFQSLRAFANSAAMQGSLPGQTQRRVAGNRPSPVRPPNQRRRRGIIVEPKIETLTRPVRPPSPTRWARDLAPSGAASSVYFTVAADVSRLQSLKYEWTDVRCHKMILMIPLLTELRIGETSRRGKRVFRGSSSPCSSCPPAVPAHRRGRSRQVAAGPWLKSCGRIPPCLPCSGCTGLCPRKSSFHCRTISGN